MTVAVVWSPSPNWNQRDRRYPLQGDVSHRIVGSGPSALSLFSRPGTASSHFVIGHTQVGDPCPLCPAARGPLVIWQTVDLSLMAWTNGDVRDPTWPRYQSGVNPNLTTITTEHEDMGEAGQHIVTEHVWQASIALKRLLRSGNLAAIRQAGIRVADGAFTASALVARMAALPVDYSVYIDHHQIAGPNKPWCWRDYDADRGFPSRLAGLLMALGTPEPQEDIMKFRNPTVTEEWWTKVGTASTFWRPDGTTGYFETSERVKSHAEGNLPDGRDVRLLDYGPGHEALVILRGGLTNIPGTRIVGLPAPGGFTQADIDAARAAGRAAGIQAAKDDLTDLT